MHAPSYRGIVAFDFLDTVAMRPNGDYSSVIELEAIPGAPELLTGLTANGYRVVVLSSGSARNARPVFAALSIPSADYEFNVPRKAERLTELGRHTPVVAYVSGRKRDASFVARTATPTVLFNANVPEEEVERVTRQTELDAQAREIGTYAALGFDELHFIFDRLGVAWRDLSQTQIPNLPQTRTLADGLDR